VYVLHRALFLLCEVFKSYMEALVQFVTLGYSVSMGAKKMK